MVKDSADKEVVRLLSDRGWRLSNLYSIIDKGGKKVTFAPNWAQQELLNSLWYCNVVLKARQLGISTFVSILFLDECLFNDNVSAGIIAHTREDARHLFNRVKFSYDSLPASLKKSFALETDTVGELKFSNGSSIRIGTSLRSSTFQYLHISEFGKICSQWPEKAREIVTGALNTLATGQIVFIESTAEGKEGYFYDICKTAQAIQDGGKELTTLDYKFFFFPWHEDPSYTLEGPVTIPQAMQEYFDKLRSVHRIELTTQQIGWYVKKWQTQGDDMKREYPSYPQEAFEAASEGHYYGEGVARARKEGRIRKVYYDPNTAVHSAWDLGLSDSTSIWLFQTVGQEIRFLEYYENSNEPLTFYLDWLKKKEYTFGFHFVPHDAAAREYSTGLTRIEVAKNHNIVFTLAPGPKEIGVQEGIDAGRNILSRCYFDEEKCADGLRALENYRREWSSKGECWTNRPFHNWASHGSDSFRYLAISLHMASGSMMSREEAIALRFKHRGY